MEPLGIVRWKLQDVLERDYVHVYTYNFYQSKTNDVLNTYRVCNLQTIEEFLVLTRDHRYRLKQI